MGGRGGSERQICGVTFRGWIRGGDISRIERKSGLGLADFFLVFTTQQLINQSRHKKVTVNSFSMFAPLGKGLVVVCAFLTTLNGFIHLFPNVLNPWCQSSASQSCVGPALRWNSGDTGFTSDSNIDGWRTVLTTG